MSEGKVIVVAFFGLVTLFTGVALVCRIAGIWDTKVFGAAEENAKTEAYENTKAYRDGVKHDLDDLCLSYAKASSTEEKQAIASIAQHRIQGVPQQLVPACAWQMVRGQ